jgi:hypothetical protein
MNAGYQKSHIPHDYQYEGTPRGGNFNLFPTSTLLTENNDKVAVPKSKTHRRKTSPDLVAVLSDFTPIRQETMMDFSDGGGLRDFNTFDNDLNFFINEPATGNLALDESSENSLLKPVTPPVLAPLRPPPSPLVRPPPPPCRRIAPLQKLEMPKTLLQSRISPQPDAYSQNNQSFIPTSPKQTPKHNEKSNNSDSMVFEKKNVSHLTDQLSGDSPINNAVNTNNKTTPSDSPVSNINPVLVDSPVADDAEKDSLYPHQLLMQQMMQAKRQPTDEEFAYEMDMVAYHQVAELERRINSGEYMNPKLYWNNAQRIFDIDNATSNTMAFLDIVYTKSSFFYGPQKYKKEDPEILEDSPKVVPVQDLLHLDEKGQSRLKQRIQNFGGSENFPFERRPSADSQEQLVLVRSTTSDKQKASENSSQGPDLQFEINDYVANFKLPPSSNQLDLAKQLSEVPIDKSKAAPASNTGHKRKNTGLSLGESRSAENLGIVKSEERMFIPCTKEVPPTPLIKTIGFRSSKASESKKRDGVINDGLWEALQRRLPSSSLNPTMVSIHQDDRSAYSRHSHSSKGEQKGFISCTGEQNAGLMSRFPRVCSILASNPSFKNLSQYNKSDSSKGGSTSTKKRRRAQYIEKVILLKDGKEVSPDILRFVNFKNIEPSEVMVTKQSISDFDSPIKWTDRVGGLADKYSNRTPDKGSIKSSNKSDFGSNSSSIKKKSSSYSKDNYQLRE